MLALYGAHDFCVDLYFQPPPKAFINNTLAFKRRLRISTAVLSLLNAVACAVTTLR
jgi:hypothetical protein